VFPSSGINMILRNGDIHTWRHNPGDQNRYIHRREKLKSRRPVIHPDRGKLSPVLKKESKYIYCSNGVHAFSKRVLSHFA
jgi:hypothetical protein